jgi:DNA polymerase-1
MPKKSITKKTDQKTLVLLDSHAILHRAYHALPDFASATGEPTGALYGVVTMLLKIVEELKPDYIVACYDLPEPTYRHEVFKEYKAGRTKTDDSLVAQIIRSRDIFNAFHIPMYEHVGFEADDMLGTIVEQTSGDKNLKVIIASGDMDTLQLVDGKKVLVYTLKKGLHDTVLYDADAVMGRFGFGPKQIVDYKGLRGDPSDNIPGIKGIGEKTATDLIVEFKSVEGIYKALAKNPKLLRDAGIKERMIELLVAHKEEAEFSKMLATIRRDAPITFRLPEKTWREGIDTNKILTLFAELGFRTLATRIKNLFEIKDTEVAQFDATIPKEDIGKAAIGLWLLSSDTTNPTYEDVMQYGLARGISAFPEICADIETEIKKQNLTRVYTEIELPLFNVLRKMETTGICIDVPHLKKLSKKMHEELVLLEQKIYTHAGKEFNINSPKQLGEILYDVLELKVKNQKHTATGQRSTRESELEKLTEQHPIIHEILRYREVQKLVSTYIDPLPTLVQKDGRVHTTFLQAGSVTGRMASQNPGVQNIPIRTEEGRGIRKAFVADAGFTLVSIDYSQMELRVAAFLSGDKKMIEIFKNGEDVHQGVAARVFNVPLSDVTSDMRRQAKVINFGILYGMGVNALKANLGEGTTRAEAQEFYNAYFNTFTRLAEYLEETKAFARANGFTETYFGRRRHFPGMNSSAPFLRAQAERMAINAPVQGTSADIIRLAMVRIDSCLTEEKLDESVHMMLQVHDELVFEIKDALLNAVLPKLKQIMEGVLPLTETLGVPILAEIKTGANWDEMTKM